jgi:hypothetical protein
VIGGGTLQVERESRDVVATELSRILLMPVVLPPGDPISIRVEGKGSAILDAVAAYLGATWSLDRGVIVFRVGVFSNVLVDVLDPLAVPGLAELSGGKAAAVPRGVLVSGPNAQAVIAGTATDSFVVDFDLSLARVGKARSAVAALSAAGDGVASFGPGGAETRAGGSVRASAELSGSDDVVSILQRSSLLTRAGAIARLNSDSQFPVRKFATSPEGTVTQVDTQFQVVGTLLEFTVRPFGEAVAVDVVVELSSPRGAAGEDGAVPVERRRVTQSFVTELDRLQDLALFEGDSVASALPWLGLGSRSDSDSLRLRLNLMVRRVWSGPGS